MAKKRLDRRILQEDLDAYAALQAIAGYAPSNTAFTVANITEAHDAMNENQTLEVQKQAEADAARDASDLSEWEFHNKILGAKSQIKAQFGENSDEYAALGLKKKSEYNRGRRQTPPAPAKG